MHIRLLLIFTLLALPPIAATAQSSGGVQISATLGIGGRYRLGGWIPVTVGVVNSGSATIQGQVQVVGLDQNGQQNSSAIFARPAAIPSSSSPQFVQVDTRGIALNVQNFGVRVVEGEARGEGATLAQITSLSASQHNLFSGTPVNPRDLLLVGLTADSPSITRLNGQQWGLMHTANGIAPDQQPQQQYYSNGGGRASSNPALVEAAVASPPQLPDRPGGYDGVDAIVLRADAPLDALTEAQTDALKAWVAAGGQLIICGGANPAPYSDPFYTALLPADISAPPPGGSALMLTPKTLPGVRIVASANGQPSVVSGPYGAGRVIMLASDPAVNLSPHTEAALWKTILVKTSSSTLIGVTSAHEADNSIMFYGSSDQLSDAVMRAPSLDAPGAGVVALFLIGYVLVLVPINYLILKRMDKKEWSWVTIPVLVVIFAAATYSVGYASKGSRMFVNRAAIVETTAGQSEAGVYAAVGLFSPSRSQYDMTFSDPNALSAIPQPPQDYYSSRYSRNDPDSNTAGQTRFVEGAEDEQLQDVSVNMWAMRAFDVQSDASLGGSVTSTLAVPVGGSMVTGSITNGLRVTLTHCNLYVGSGWRPLGDLTPGASVPVTAPYFSGLRNSAMPAMPSPTDGTVQDPSGGTAESRMTSALAAFVNGVSGSNSSGQYYFGNNDGAPVVFQPHADEAILTGWCDNPALAATPIHIDGRDASEHSVTLVVVHIPLHAP